MKKTRMIMALTAGVGIACAVSCSSVQKKDTAAMDHQDAQRKLAGGDAGLVGPDGEVYLFFKNSDGDVVIKQCDRYTVLQDRKDCKERPGTDEQKVSAEEFKRSMKAALYLHCRDEGGLDKQDGDHHEGHCDIQDDQNAKQELDKIVAFVDRYGKKNAEPDVDEKIKHLTEVTEANKVIDHLVDDIVGSSQLYQIVYSDDKYSMEFNLLRAFVKNPGLSAEFAHIRPGTFQMGSPNSEANRSNDEVLHTVSISRGFEMQTTVVTQAQYFMVMGYNPSYFRERQYCQEDYTEIHGTHLCPNHPVEQVSWDDAQEFMHRLNHPGGEFQYRLPTEAEWEYSARAGTQTAYYFGNDPGQLDANGWYSNNSGNQTHAVGRKGANAFGLYDMAGNVWEWTQDYYGGYSNSQVTDPAGPSSGSDRVIRGGSWHYGPAPLLRSAFRYYVNVVPGARGSGLGFRLVRTPQ